MIAPAFTAAAFPDWDCGMMIETGPVGYPKCRDGSGPALHFSLERK